MAVLDLKPLNKETIQKMGVDSHELWIVKLQEVVYGPFESESLKEYAAKNEPLFDEAFATRIENHDFQPFFNHALFQRRGPQVVRPHAVVHDYWILEQGQKVGPLTKKELDKRIELGSIGLTGLVSTSDGDTWNKLYQIEGFENRFHSGSELPFSPVDTSFQEARLQLIEKVEANAGTPKQSDELASLAHSSQIKGKILYFRSEDIPLKSPEQVEMSEALKWQVPSAVAALLVMTIGVYSIFSGPEEDPELATLVGEMPRKGMIRTTPRIVQPNPSLQEMPRRAPANSRPKVSRTVRSLPSERSANNSDYPTHVETHQNDYPVENNYDNQVQPDDGRDPAAENPGANDNQEAQQATGTEHSLVGQPEDGNMSLDAAMGNPPVEEASEF